MGDSPLPEDIQELIASVSHQVNNHLAVILARLSLLSQTTRDDSLGPALAAINTSVQACHTQMARLVDLIDP